MLSTAHGNFGATLGDSQQAAAIPDAVPLVGPIESAATGGGGDNGHAARRKQSSGVDSWQSGRHRTQTAPKERPAVYIRDMFELAESTALSPMWVGTDELEGV
ncbi:uncharacterized protein PG986_002160 [Apiospora aurea]|uniref:Uncharacterized protein n=1 Tax=Apiospora aurea TaxID=335848 RepID=A0ABR1QYY8_9PEZI